MLSAELRDKKGWLFDLDGCLYHTDQPAPGAQELLELLQRDGKQVACVTNNSRQSPGEIAEKLAWMGFDLAPDQIFPATDAVGRYIRKRYGVSTVMVAGSESLERAIEGQGHRTIQLDAVQTADIIVIGRDTEFTFDKLQAIVEQEKRGARIVTANPDMWHPGPGGRRVPETGALAAAVAAITGKPMETVGKPEPHLFQYAMRLFGADPEQCVMVGDNLNTDIAGGRGAGMSTVWIRGLDPIQQVGGGAEEPTPNLVVLDMLELLALYKGFSE
ncbi:HAD-IIA family hydrolase [Paenibacillus sp. HJGM_3]|uniref:HAD-IIA family hydrolase n=1 Tax=Paenibacillus sp. HJGM_3 TaxID=3379816 RepID=UPI0038589F59